MDNCRKIAENEDAIDVEIIPLSGKLAQLLGSEIAAFYEKAGLCCDD